jgi:hypothetical protein
MQLRHLRVLSYIPLHAARLTTVDGLHETIFRIIADMRASATPLRDHPVDLDGCVAAMAASSAVQE